MIQFVSVALDPPGMTPVGPPPRKDDERKTQGGTVRVALSGLILVSISYLGLAP